ncbi:nuclear transport factor 2 family protein [Amycolatopsis acidicola]|uniref:Nuclear transport factor 2 family protein n=1 Tax=Amycolatopsis acidicola TaxID=2596893 RepID=A0A5N0UZQ4_9PSEU|nr:nuclear transport factor 2 family protein [Amycolatopsis acidicola]KAA9159470.1 nuclear transport factor 2 family protein [Amycolatopsis acidicola]
MNDSPADVFRRLSEGISGGRWGELGELYAEDTVVEHPQRPPAGARMTGRAAVAQRFTAMGSAIELRARDVVVHETTDPEVIVAEYTYDGPGFTSANIQMLRVRDGLITHSRDYHDFYRMAAASDGLGELAELYENNPMPELAPDFTPSATDTRGKVVEELLLGVTLGKGAETAGLYAEDAYVTHPFGIDSPPLKGREELRAHFAPARGAGMGVRGLVLHRGLDPEVVIAEFAYVGRRTRPFVASNIFVLRIKGNLIAESRDYGDHLALAAADQGVAPLL